MKLKEIKCFFTGGHEYIQTSHLNSSETELIFVHTCKRCGKTKIWVLPTTTAIPKFLRKKR